MYLLPLLYSPSFVGVDRLEEEKMNSLEYQFFSSECLALARDRRFVESRFPIRGNRISAFLGLQQGFRTYSITNSPSKPMQQQTFIQLGTPDSRVMIDVGSLD